MPAGKRRLRRERGDVRELLEIFVEGDDETLGLGGVSSEGAISEIELREGKAARRCDQAARAAGELSKYPKI